MEGRGDSNEPDKEERPNCLAGARTGRGGAADVFGDFARGYELRRVAAPTRKTYEANCVA